MMILKKVIYYIFSIILIYYIKGIQKTDDEMNDEMNKIKRWNEYKS